MFGQCCGCRTRFALAYSSVHPEQLIGRNSLNFFGSFWNVQFCMLKSQRSMIILHALRKLDVQFCKLKCQRSSRHWIEVLEHQIQLWIQRFPGTWSEQTDPDSFYYSSACRLSKRKYIHYQSRSTCFDAVAAARCEHICGHHEKITFTDFFYSEQRIYFSWWNLIYPFSFSSWSGNIF